MVAPWWGPGIPNGSAARGRVEGRGDVQQVCFDFLTVHETLFRGLKDFHLLNVPESCYVSRGAPRGDVPKVSRRLYVFWATSVRFLQGAETLHFRQLAILRLHQGGVPRVGARVSPGDQAESP